MDAAKGAVRRVTLEGGKELDVKIPAGVQTGQQIKLSGQGRPGQKAGHLATHWSRSPLRIIRFYARRIEH